MGRWALSLGFGSALVACIALGMAGTARAATLPFTGTLGINIFGMRELLPSPPWYGPRIYLTVPGAGSAQLTDDGSLHLLSLTLPSGAFGPSTVTFPGSRVAGTGISSLRFTLSQNLSGKFSGISGGPTGGGPMGLSGVAKVCLTFATSCIANISVPLTPTPGGAGFGTGGTVTVPGAVSVTMQNAPWTIGQPIMTIHTPNSTITTPMLPGGFAHGPASLTSSTAQPSGVLQLVTVSKVYTSLTGAFPEVPLSGVLTLHFVPEPGTLMLIGSGIGGLALYGRRKRGR
jgi:hypothetical protein